MNMEKTTENSGFLDGRDYTAAFLYEFVALLVGNGVYANELAPTATNENMTITHGSGRAWINGVLYKNTTPFVMDIDTADGSLNRYDSLVVRLNLSLNETYALIVKGEFATNPTPPKVVRNAETYDLKICDIYIPAGCTEIKQSQITDTRLDAAVCGVPIFPVQHLDMTTFYHQVADDLASFKKNEQANFETWADSEKESRLATMAELVESVRATSSYSTNEILNILQQLNTLVDNDAVGSLVNEINELKKLQFTNTTVLRSAFEANTYDQEAFDEGYTYMARIPLEGVIASMITQVYFGAKVTSLMSTSADTYNGGVIIYANSVPDDDFTIPTILLWRGMPNG